MLFPGIVECNPCHQEHRAFVTTAFSGIWSVQFQKAWSPSATQLADLGPSLNAERNVDVSTTEPNSELQRNHMMEPISEELPLHPHFEYSATEALLFSTNHGADHHGAINVPFLVRTMSPPSPSTGTHPCGDSLVREHGDRTGYNADYLYQPSLQQCSHHCLLTIITSLII